MTAGTHLINHANERRKKSQDFHKNLMVFIFVRKAGMHFIIAYNAALQSSLRGTLKSRTNETKTNVTRGMRER